MRLSYGRDDGGLYLIGLPWSKAEPAFSDYWKAGCLLTAADIGLYLLGFAGEPSTPTPIPAAFSLLSLTAEDYL